MKKILFVASSLLIAGQVQAGPITPCTQANLNGSYVVYNAAVTGTTLTDAGSLNHTGRCEVSINNGALTGTCAFDSNNSGAHNFHGPVYGTATMNTNCSAAMTMSFDPVPDVVHIDSEFDVQFLPNKEGFIGKFENNFGVYGSTSGTRFSPSLPATTAP